jgi:predicted metal-binding membrane protein
VRALAARGSTTVTPLAALLLATLAAWVALLQLDMMATRPLTFLGGWTVMMAAMMLPSAAPLVLVYGKRGRARLVLGYLLVWAAAGIPVYALASAVDLMMVPAGAVAAVLAAAGVYQFTPLKNVCLRACRSPLDFVATRWGRGPLRLGIDHGVYCVGCCWALMAVLVVAAAMSVTTAAVIAGVVLAEKVLPGGEWTSRAVGLVLIVAAVLVLV